MKNIKKLITFALIVVIFAGAIFPLQAFAQVPLVPCGRTGQADCQFSDLVIMLVRLINYLISLAALVAIYYILLAGFNLVTALGNAEKIESGKNTLSHAVVGFALVILAFVFLNWVVYGIFGQPATSKKWWDPSCIYGVSNPAGCPIVQITPVP